MAVGDLIPIGGGGFEDYEPFSKVGCIRNKMHPTILEITGEGYIDFFGIAVANCAAHIEIDGQKVSVYSGSQFFMGSMNDLTFIREKSNSEAFFKVMDRDTDIIDQCRLGMFDNGGGKSYKKACVSNIVTTEHWNNQLSSGGNVNGYMFLAQPLYFKSKLKISTSTYGASQIYFIGGIKK